MRPLAGVTLPSAISRAHGSSSSGSGVSSHWPIAVGDHQPLTPLDPLQVAAQVVAQFADSHRGAHVHEGNTLEALSQGMCAFATLG